MNKLKRKSGSVLVEVLVSMLIFVVGLMGVVTVMTMSLKIINKAGDDIILSQELIDRVDMYILERVYTHDVTPSGTDVTMVSSVQVMDIEDVKLSCNIYRYKNPGKDTGYFDVLQKEKE